MIKVLLITIIFVFIISLILYFNYILLGEFFTTIFFSIIIGLALKPAKDNITLSIERIILYNTKLIPNSFLFRILYIIKFLLMSILYLVFSLLNYSFKINIQEKIHNCVMYKKLLTLLDIQNKDEREDAIPTSNSIDDDHSPILKSIRDVKTPRKIKFKREKTILKRSNKSNKSNQSNQSNNSLHSNRKANKKNKIIPSTFFSVFQYILIIYILSFKISFNFFIIIAVLTLIIDLLIRISIDVIMVILVKFEILHYFCSIKFKHIENDDGDYNNERKHFSAYYETYSDYPNVNTDDEEDNAIIKTASLKPIMHTFISSLLIVFCIFVLTIIMILGVYLTYRDINFLFEFVKANYSVKEFIAHYVPDEFDLKGFIDEKFINRQKSSDDIGFSIYNSGKNRTFNLLWENISKSKNKKNNDDDILYDSISKIDNNKDSYFNYTGNIEDIYNNSLYSNDIYYDESEMHSNTQTSKFNIDSLTYIEEINDSNLEDKEIDSNGNNISMLNNIKYMSRDSLFDLSYQAFSNPVNFTNKFFNENTINYIQSECSLKKYNENILNKIFNTLSLKSMSNMYCGIMMLYNNMGLEVSQSISNYLIETYSFLAKIFTSVLDLVFNNLMNLGFELINSFMLIIILLSCVFYFLINTNHNSDIINECLELLPIEKKTAKRISDKLKLSLQGIFLSSFQIFISHFIITWLFFDFYNIPLTFIFSITAGIVSLMPIFSPFILLLPGSVFMSFRGDEMNYIIFINLFLFNIGYIVCINSALNEIYKNNFLSHPYVTGLSFVMGFYSMGFTGIIYGPTILCVSILVRDLIKIVMTDIKN